MHQEYQYLNLIKNVLKNGVCVPSRNGKVYSIFGCTMRFSLRENTLPLLTTKQMGWKTCMRELMWFIRGETNNNELNKNKVHIWDGNASKEYLNSIGLDYQDGELGPIYGYQWRNFNGNYPNNKVEKIVYDKLDKEIGPKDQMRWIISQLIDEKKRHSRRLILTAWNPLQLKDMALPPCHVLCQFWVNPETKELSCQLYQRSGDIGLGVPFNIASYSMLTIMIARYCGLNPGEFIHVIGDAHIYEEHIGPLKEQIEREPFPFPKWKISHIPRIFEEFDVSDVSLEDYIYHPKISMKMIV